MCVSIHKGYILKIELKFLHETSPFLFYATRISSVSKKKFIKNNKFSFQYQKKLNDDNPLWISYACELHPKENKIKKQSGCQ